jgi:hypothetical protein
MTKCSSSVLNAHKVLFEYLNINCTVSELRLNVGTLVGRGVSTLLDHAFGLHVHVYASNSNSAGLAIKH